MAEYKKDDNSKCVKVNIFVKCDDSSWRKEDSHKKEDTCVEVNIYAECEECKKIIIAMTNNHQTQKPCELMLAGLFDEPNAL